MSGKVLNDIDCGEKIIVDPKILLNNNDAVH